MPRRDGKGPNGEGKLTGRGLGNCATNNETLESKYDNDEKMSFQRGLRKCRGRREKRNRGNRRRYCQ